MKVCQKNPTKAQKFKGLTDFQENVKIEDICQLYFSSFYTYG